MNWKVLTAGIAILIIIVAFFVFNSFQKTKINYNQVELNDDSEGVPSSPMNLKVKVSPFTQDYVGLITLELGAREGYPVANVNWQNVKTEFSLSNGIQLISGDTSWNANIEGSEIAENTISIKILSEGEHHIVISSRKELGTDGFIGDYEDLYILLVDGKVYVSNKPLVQQTNQGIAIQICPTGQMFDVNTKDCVDEVRNTNPQQCPEGTAWDSTQNKCIVLPT